MILKYYMLGYTFAVNCTVTRTSIKKLFWACSEWYWISHACSAVLLPAKHNSNKKIFLERQCRAIHGTFIRLKEV